MLIRNIPTLCCALHLTFNFCYFFFVSTSVRTVSVRLMSFFAYLFLSAPLRIFLYSGFQIRHHLFYLFVHCCSLSSSLDRLKPSKFYKTFPIQSNLQSHCWHQCYVSRRLNWCRSKFNDYLLLTQHYTYHQSCKQ